MNNNRGAIFLGIDGCLISKDANVPSIYYKSLAWLSNYIMGANLGINPNIRFCSGRSIPFVEAISLIMGKPNVSWVIVENGVVLYNPITKEGPRFVPCISAETIKIFDWIRKKAISQILKDYPNLSVWPGNIFSIIFSRKTGSRMTTDEIRKSLAKSKLLRRLVWKRNIRIICSRDSISIVPPQVYKGTAVDFLAKEEELDLRRSLGIGDSKHDISFLNKTKFVGCPSNADESCKKFVKGKGSNGRVSRFCHAMGVVDIICHFTGAEAPDFLKNA